ncbi:isochorismatase family cysteine hydrolase [Clostridium estertheticum]|uniref:isochorismatase family cysteine hydrolase n=1 Tax=Clostridium estertheticum TaxID=238834 RepID=UPI001C6F2F4E|nr:isochorismatase family cysteine hydrolase [Clostridium estertheticum]MBW9154320.1 cysteine hydrolase [Clostridium estertheticum]WLC86639.1 cysteine hydrolase [Clostridium estertheticum]
MGNKALLVVDIQEDNTGRTARKPLPYKNSFELINNVNVVINDCKEKDTVVIYIKHEIKNNLFNRILAGRLIKSTDGSEIDSRVNIISNYIYSKNKGDAFSNLKLGDFLEQRSINEVFIVGLDASACVLKTSIGAKNRGYRVVVLKDAITTMNMSKMPKLLNKYLEHEIELATIEEFQKLN